MTTDVVYKDFTKPKKRVEFRIDEDLFEAPRVLPIPVMQELASTADRLKGNLSNAEQLQMVISIFDTILPDAAAARLRERISSKEEPVDLEQIMDIMLWLLEVYGLRPTQPSADSSAGQPAVTSGTPSAAGAPSVV